MESKLNSKQRAKLRGYASSIDTIFHVGKNGVTDNVIIEIDNALEARELIKIKVLENSGKTPKEVALEIQEELDKKRIIGEVITVIGTKIVIYRKNKEPIFKLD